MRRVLLMVSADNGLSQRTALALRAAGHSVRKAVVDGAADMRAATVLHDFDLILAPFLKAKVPHEIYNRWPTVIIHPGPPGDRGPSALDWAILDGEPVWGVTALSAVEEMDAGPVWAWRAFDMPAGVWRKSAVYGGPTSDAAVECALEAVAHAGDADFRPTPQHQVERAVPRARPRPTAKQADRSFGWAHDAASIVRRVRASDGFPGVATELAGLQVFVYDVEPDAQVDGTPGAIVSRHHHAIRVACGAGSVWIGYLRARVAGGSFKAPALEVLSHAGVDVESIPQDPHRVSPEIRYFRRGAVGVVTTDFYNGAANARQCRRLAAAIRWAALQDTRVLVLKGNCDSPHFANGIHLGSIEIASTPELEAWDNIVAINDVCRALLLCPTQLTVAAFTGSAGAGGVMMPLSADLVVARDGVVLNPHYATMGLHGSELHTYTLPRRIGEAAARRLLDDCLPVDPVVAHSMGLIDAIGPRKGFDDWLEQFAAEYADPGRFSTAFAVKSERLGAGFPRKPLEAYVFHELGEMARDIFDDRSGFADKRRRFIRKLSDRRIPLSATA
jgi:putative two-component system protein, hydrogenase maturation factor HypX/HoxX